MSVAATSLVAPVQVYTEVAALASGVPMANPPAIRHAVSPAPRRRSVLLFTIPSKEQNRRRVSPRPRQPSSLMNTPPRGALSRGASHLSGDATKSSNGERPQPLPVPEIVSQRALHLDPDLSAGL